MQLGPRPLPTRPSNAVANSVSEHKEVGSMTTETQSRLVWIVALAVLLALVAVVVVLALSAGGGGGGGY